MAGQLNTETREIEEAPTENEKKMGLEHEIECPRCNDIMNLSSDFDRLCYFCEECNFFLFLQ
jgi:PP-loop superfamily ATP-utilizing enzyme